MKPSRLRRRTAAPVRAAPGSVAQLRRRIAGRLLAPDDEPYIEAVRGSSIDSRPAIVVAPSCAADVATIVSFATAHRLTVTTRPEIGAIMVTPILLTGVDVDPDTWTAWVEPGVTGTQILLQAQDVDLAPVLDTEPSKGIVSTVVDGGAGWLARRYGLGIDHVRSIEVVTADGVIRSTSIEDEPDLFWAIAAAGSDAVGVITSMEIDLAPVGPVHAGELHYRSAELEQVAYRYTRWTEETSDQLTASLILVPGAEGDNFPESGNRPSIIVRGCHLGTEDDAEASLDYWRRWRTPEFDRWTTTTFGAFAVGSDRAAQAQWLGATHWLSEMDSEIPGRLLDLLSTPDGSPRIETIQIIDLGPRRQSPSAAGGRAASRWCLSLWAPPASPPDPS